MLQLSTWRSLPVHPKYQCLFLGSWSHLKIWRLGPHFQESTYIKVVSITYIHIYIYLTYIFIYIYLHVNIYIFTHVCYTWTSLVAQLVVCLQCGRARFDPWVRKIPWRRKWQPTPVFLPGESRGQRSLVGYSPWGHKESDTTEWQTLYIYIYIYMYIYNIVHKLESRLPGEISTTSDKQMTPPLRNKVKRN